MFRSRSWFGGGWGRPKNLHSIEHLKYLYNVLSRNQTVSEHNRGLLVETLRSIAEILIWGDQNDSSVFDFFLEKNMLSFFLRIMKQRSGGSSYVCVQLLQTLNILFENIRNETSLYYLLSNNHVNSIIVHKFDFSDEEVMAYYISFLKTLSLKLNAHTIHFFYNEHTNDFPLYTEAIKFFNHSESMVRIAVRTLTLNVYRVEDTSMLGFIRDRTAAPYFSNLVWFIGKHVLELDNCVRYDIDHQSQNRLSDLVAEHLDHLHYLNDILCLNITDLNQVLTEHLLLKLLIPLYIYSLMNFSSSVHINTTLDLSLDGVTFSSDSSKAFADNLSSLLRKSPYHYRHSPELTAEQQTNPRVSCVVALFLLSQVFLIITHGPLVHSLAWVILNADVSVFKHGATEILQSYRDTKERESNVQSEEIEQDSASVSNCKERNHVNNESPVISKIENQNITDEEKELLVSSPRSSTVDCSVNASQLCEGHEAAATLVQATRKPFLETILNALDVSENDYSALFALCLLFALANNKGINPDLLSPILGTTGGGVALCEHLLRLVTFACQPNSGVRLVTLALTLRLLSKLTPLMTNTHKQILTAAREQSTAAVRNFYKSEEIFLDMFEHEYFEMSKGPLNVEWLCMDAAILLPPTATPMSGIEFTKRRPCGEVERARRAIRVFFLMRDLSMNLNGEPETQLPLTNPQQCIQVNNVLDLNNSDLISCTVIMKDGVKLRRFLVIDVIQLILVEPDTKRLGWGVAKLVGFLQDIEVLGDKDDSRCLHITIQRPLSSNTTNRVPLLSAKFIFDDHIRCMAAKQRLTKGRMKARQKKMQQIARLLDIPGATGGFVTSTPLSVGGQAAGLAAGLNALSRAANRGFNRGFMTRPGAVLRIGSPSATVTKDSETTRTRDSKSPSSAARIAIKGGQQQVVRSRDNVGTKPRSREGSPRMPRPRSEEIPLELIKKSGSINTGDKFSSSHAQTSKTVNEQDCISENVIAEKTELQNDSNLKKTSEETSFIAQQNEMAVNSSSSTGAKRKGIVETV